MNNAVYYVLVIVAGYFCGCIESGYLVGKLCGMDIRDYGSGNSGTTNVLRVLGKTRALLTFLGDALKSFIPVLVVKFLLCPAVPTLNADLIQLVTGFAAVMGHDYPVFLKFKGGKGIAATAGIIFSIDWRLTVICLSCFILLVAVTRYVSLGSLVVSVILLVWDAVQNLRGAYGLIPGRLEFTAVTAVITVMAFWRHRANIGRLLKGTENKVGAKKQ